MFSGITTGPALRAVRQFRASSAIDRLPWRVQRTRLTLSRSRGAI
jgi:hypothetical protein